MSKEEKTECNLDYFNKMIMTAFNRYENVSDKQDEIDRKIYAFGSGKHFLKLEEEKVILIPDVLKEEEEKEVSKLIEEFNKLQDERQFYARVVTAQLYNAKKSGCDLKKIKID